MELKDKERDVLDEDIVLNIESRPQNQKEFVIHNFTKLRLKLCNDEIFCIKGYDRESGRVVRVDLPKKPKEITNEEGKPEEVKEITKWSYICDWGNYEARYPKFAIAMLTNQRRLIGLGIFESAANARARLYPSEAREEQAIDQFTDAMRKYGNIRPNSEEQQRVLKLAFKYTKFTENDPVKQKFVEVHVIGERKSKF